MLSAYILLLLFRIFIYSLYYDIYSYIPLHFLGYYKHYLEYYSILYMHIKSFSEALKKHIKKPYILTTPSIDSWLIIRWKDG